MNHVQVRHLDVSGECGCGAQPPIGREDGLVNAIGIKILGSREVRHLDIGGEGGNGAQPPIGRERGAVVDQAGAREYGLRE